MKKASLVEVKNHFSQYLHDAEDEQVVITRHGKPAGVLIGFKNEDDWFEFRLLHDPDFLKRIEKARTRLQQGKGIPWEQVKHEVP